MNYYIVNFFIKLDEIMSKRQQRQCVVVRFTKWLINAMNFDMR